MEQAQKPHNGKNNQPQININRAVTLKGTAAYTTGEAVLNCILLVPNVRPRFRSLS